MILKKKYIIKFKVHKRTNIYIISTPYDPNVSFTTTLYFTLLLKWMKSERCTRNTTTKKIKLYRIARTIRVNKIKYEIYHVSVVR